MSSLELTARVKPLRGHASSARLQALTQSVPLGARVADIGSGHGILPRLILLSRRAPFVVATERTPKRLAQVRIVPTTHPLAGQVELRAGDGLLPLTAADRIDLVVISGMGGPSIARILAQRSETQVGFRQALLQPQSGWPELRGWLAANQWRLEAEQLLRDSGRWYLILSVVRGKQRWPELMGLTHADIIAGGPLLLARGCEHSLRYWQAQRRRLQHIVDTSPSCPKRAQASLDQAQRLVAYLDPQSGGSGRFDTC